MSDAGPGQLLFEFVRHWSRRATAADPAVAEQGRRILVTEAVNAVRSRGVPATVNAIAHELGIDQSGASRMVKDATVAGYLAGTTSTADGRRRETTVTAAGLDALAHAHAWQERIFADLTAGWTRRRRNDFADAMAELITRSHSLAP